MDVFTLTPELLRDPGVQSMIYEEMKRYIPHILEDMYADTLALINRPGAVLIDASSENSVAIKVIAKDGKTYTPTPLMPCCKGGNGYCVHFLAGQVVLAVQHSLAAKHEEKNNVSVVDQPTQPVQQSATAPSKEPLALCSLKWSDASGIEYYYRVIEDTDEACLERVKKISDLIKKSLARNQESAPRANGQPSTPPASAAPPVPTGLVVWDGKRPTETSPEHVLCPLHPAAKMKRRGPNDYGYWYSHKQGNEWCMGKKEKE